MKLQTKSKARVAQAKIIKTLIMHELNIETRQQYHKHGVMHRAFVSLKNCRCIKAIKLIFSMVHNTEPNITFEYPALMWYFATWVCKKLKVAQMQIELNENIIYLN